MNKNHNPGLFGIVGWKNSGKTTLVERLIGEFTARGLVVSAVKHAHHEFDVDQPGRDSYRFRSAGARRTAIVSSKRWAMIHELREEKEPPLHEIIEQVGACDIILVEGYKNYPHPKIEARHKDTMLEALENKCDNVVALAYHGDRVATSLPQFDINKIGEIADFISQHMQADPRHRE